MTQVNEPVNGLEDQVSYANVLLDTLLRQARAMVKPTDSDSRRANEIVKDLTAEDMDYIMPRLYRIGERDRLQ